MDLRERNRILGALKRCFSRSQLRRDALVNALSKRKGPRGGKQYICKGCKKAFPENQIHVDHKDPAIPIGTAFAEMSWDYLMERLWCSPKNLQILCHPCHKAKSKEEAKLRADARKEQRDSKTTSS